MEHDCGYRPRTVPGIEKIPAPGGAELEEVALFI
jgi:hypothetical protein